MQCLDAMCNIRTWVSKRTSFRCDMGMQGVGVTWCSALGDMLRCCNTAVFSAWTRVTAALVILSFFILSSWGATFAASSSNDWQISISLSYMQTFVGITDFKVGNAYNDDTRALVTYTLGDKTQVIRSDHFDWLAMVDKISFENSSKTSVAGSLGLKLRGGAKLELEIGHESFPAYFHAASGDGGRPGFYLLAQDLAFDVIRGHKKQLTVVKVDYS